jgi:hypothetical protein
MSLNGFNHLHMRTATMTEFTNRIAAAASALALSLALIAGTVNVPQASNAPAAQVQGLI